MDINKSKEFFNENGYLILKPGEILDLSYFDILSKQANDLLPNYIDGEVDSKINNSREDPRFYHENKIGNLLYIGCPLEHRYRIGRGSADISKDTNYLYGRRVILPERNFSKELISFIENEKILNLISKMYATNSSNLSFHNGSLSRVFPGCTGESKKMHIDTPGFVKNRASLINPDNFLINVFSFITDITEDLAPMRIIPGSHKRYSDINKAMAKYFRGNIKKNNVTQAGHIYDELLEGLNLEKPINLVGKAGTIILMNSGILHSASENYTKNLYRDVIIANYSKKSDSKFRKKYFKEYTKDSTIFFKNATNKKLFERTFKNNLKNNMDELSVKALIRSNLNKINSVKNFIRPHYVRSKRLFHKNLEDKKYLNVGAGNKWRHSDFISLDLADDVEINFDLNKEKKLPFNNNYLKGIYTSHCLEHLKFSEVQYWLTEFYRVLSKGSIVRITVPDIMLFFEAYENKDAAFYNWIRASGAYVYDSWLRSIVRQFASPVVDQFSDEEIYELYEKKNKIDFLNFFEQKVEAITDEKYLWPQIHKSWWSHERFTTELKKSGFETVKIYSHNTSGNNIFIGNNFNKTRPHMSLYIEGIK